MGKVYRVVTLGTPAPAKPELETIRYKLLRWMTDSTAANDAQGDIEQFLELKPEKLHPNYRCYNYEAVAVYLWDHRWTEATRTGCCEAKAVAQTVGRIAGVALGS